MGRSTRVLLAGFAWLVSVLMTTVAGADDVAAPPQQVILVVDINQILREAAAVQALQEQIGAARESFQAEIRKREEELRQRDQDLARERPNLSAGEYETRRQALANELAQLQSDLQERRRQLDQAMNEGMRQIQSYLLPILQTLAEQRGASMLVSKTSIVLVRPELEITGDALRMLNEALPTVSVLPSN